MVVSVTEDRTLYISCNDEESDPLVDGAMDVLEGEGIYVSVVRGSGGWFRSKLEDQTR